MVLPVTYKNILRVGSVLASYSGVIGALVTTLYAKGQEPLPGMPRNTTSVQFQTSAVRQVEQDILSARLQSWSKDAKADVVQNKINHMMNEALKAAKGNAHFVASTSDYNVRRDEKQGLWIGSQTLVLQGNTNTKSKTFSEFVGSLQKKGWALQSYGYELSFAKRQSVENEMRAEIIKNALHTAKDVLSTELGRNFLRFSQIDFDPMPFGVFQARGSKVYGAEMADMSTANVETTPHAAPEQTEIMLSARVTAVFE